MRHNWLAKILTSMILLLLQAGVASAEWEVRKQGLVNKNHRINQTVDIPQEFAFPVTKISAEKIQAVFNMVKALDLPFEYVKECCYERGYKMSQKIHTLGIKHLRVIVDGRHLPQVDKWGHTFQWFFHTAPALVDLTGRIWILDPAIETSAVPLNDWLRKFANPLTNHTLYLANEYLYADSEIDDQITYNAYARPQVMQAVEGGLLGCEVLQARYNKQIQAPRQETLSCSLYSKNLKHTQENNVSDFWAQQLIGLDLVEMYFAEMKNRSSLPKVKIHIWDSPIDFNYTTNRASHGTSVASFFINGQQASSVVGVFDIKNPQPTTGSEFMQVAQELKPQKQTQLINLSGGWRSYTDELHGAVQTVLKKNAVIIQAAGNTPVTDSVKSDFQPDDSSFIRVGSLTPEGLVSSFSGIRSDFLVHAPSDEFLTARAGPKGWYSRFSHTSGATPLVTGTLANALAVNPNLTRIQLQKLLLETSIKMKSEATNQTEYHIVNSYLLFLSAISSEALQGQRLHVKRGLNQALSVLNRSFPKCVGPTSGVKVVNETCSSIKANFDILRQNFYLNPSIEDADKIACIYKTSGFEKESNFFANWVENQKGQLTEKLLRENKDRQLLLRNIRLLKADASKDLLKNFRFNKDDFDLEFYAYLMTAAQHGPEIVSIFKSLAKQERERFINKVTSIGESRSYVYETAARDPELSVRIASLMAFYTTQDKELKKRLLFLIDEEEERIWNILSYFLDRYEAEIRFMVAIRLMDKPSQSVQNTILDSLHLMTSHERKLILRKALKSEFPEIRQRAESVK